MMTNQIRRPGFVTFLAVLHFVGTAVWVLAIAACLFGGASSSADTRFGLNIIAGICAVFAGLQLACGIGLWTLRPYGRILQFALAIPFLLSFPFGTAISILLLIYLSKPGIKVIFADRPATDLSQEDWNAVRADGGLPGVAVAAIVLIAIGPVLVVPIFAAIAIPGLLRARMTGNEVAAAAVLNDTTIAQVAYLKSCGNGGYATSYVVLGTPVPGTEPFVSQELGGSAMPQKSGYSFSLQAGAESQPGPMDCMGRPTVTSWYATASPQSFGSTGTRTFAANDRDGVWESRDRVPPAEPFRRPATRVR